MIVIGVDPGQMHTGLALVDTLARTVIAHSTVTNAHGTTTATDGLAPYMREVIDAIRAMLGPLPDGTRPVNLLAVEGVKRPNAHVRERAAGGPGLIDPTPLLATASVYGAVISRGWGVHLVTVAPGKNGSAPLGTYPECLVSPREQAKTGWRARTGGGMLRHERSAYDVAMAGPRALIVQGLR